MKVIRPDLADSTDFIRRFEAEAQLVARLEHPHIVPLYDYWREPAARTSCSACSAVARPATRSISGGAWSLARVSRLVEEIGGALIAAHAAGVIHNDVKASNVLLDDAGAAYLADFGIAVTGDDAGDAASATDVATSAGCSGSCSPVPGRLSAGVSSRPGGSSGRRADAPAAGRGAAGDGADGGYTSVAELVLAWRPRSAARRRRLARRVR